MIEFIKSHGLSNMNYLIVDKMCNVKNIKVPCDVIIPFGFVDTLDLVSNTYVHLPELLASINVNTITYYNSYNETRLRNIANRFNIPIYKNV